MIQRTDQGLYCATGGFTIDPQRKVGLALVTHAHSDHVRKGCEQYVCAEASRGLLARRVGLDAPIQSVPYRTPLRFGDVEVSFHPAGHVLGSAQIRLQRGKEVWVVSGDYKRQPDPTCEPFEVIPCDTFITETTFAHPSYSWCDPGEVLRDMSDWWRENRSTERNSVLFCYALGKAQRVLAGLRPFADRPIWVSEEIEIYNECYRAEGVLLPPVRVLEREAASIPLKGELVVATHGLLRSKEADLLGDFQSAFVSGWMKTGAFGMRSRYDRGFPLSDHADWPALLETVRQTGARKVLLLEDRESVLVEALRKRGINAFSLTKNRPIPEFPVVQGDFFLPFSGS